jgi:hypothetical protein
MRHRIWLAGLVLALLGHEAPAENALKDISLQRPPTLAVHSGRNGSNLGAILRFDGRRSISAQSALPSVLAQSASAIARSYSTSFISGENPISEGKRWLNGRTDGLDWADVRTMPGLAFGVSLPSKYADPTAVLSGEWGSDQQAEGMVSVKTKFSTCCHEVELRLRTTISPHSITGYEILCSVVSNNPYLNIVRWNGPLNDFTDVSKSDLSCADGDLLKAVAVGDTITVYKNGTRVVEGKDSSYTSGSPGIGFYDDSNNIWGRLGFSSWSKFGFSDFSATDDVRIP